MALTKGVNSYATAAEATIYFADRLNSEAWVNASSDEKDQALVSATVRVDQNQFLGIIRDPDQTLAFPRIGTYFDPKKGYNVDFTTEVPNDIIRATYETALSLLIYGTTPTSNAGELSRIKVDVIELEYSSAPATVTQDDTQAYASLQPYLLKGGGSIWWRAN